jgi:protein-S-isoprenylcysteine O-methyltransferase Ste14
MIRSIVSALVFIALIAAGWGSFDFFRYLPHIVLCIGMLITPLVYGGGESGIKPGKERGESTFEFYLIIVISSIGIGFTIPFLYAHGYGKLTASEPLQYIGVLFCVSGYAFRLIAIRALKRQFSYFVAIQQHHQLITTGVYSWIRHPIYLGAILLVVGMVLIFPTWYGFLFILFYSMLLAHRMNQEEKLLLKHFGTVYQEYLSKSHRLIPRIY